MDEFHGLATMGMILLLTVGYWMPTLAAQLLYNGKKKGVLWTPGTFQKRYGWLFLRYEPSYYQWEITQILRKAAAVVVAILMTNYPQVPHPQ